MSDTEAKTHDASNRKLRKLRNEGSVASSNTFSRYTTLAAGLIVLLATAQFVWQKMAANIIVGTQVMQVPFDEALDIATSSFTRILFWTVIPVFAAVFAIAVLASLLFNKGVVFAIKPVMPQLSRVSMGSGLKRIYGRRGWIENGVALLRVSVWLAFAAIMMVLLLPRLFVEVDCGLQCQGQLVHPIAWLLPIGAIALLLLFAGTDTVLQQRLFLHEQRMTESELKRERKDQSGSKEVRKERNRLRAEARRGGGAVGADVANICYHGDGLAIGVIFNPPEEQFPRVVAKAKGLAEVTALRKALHQNGCREMENGNLVKIGYRVELGGSLPSNVFGEFAGTLPKLF